MHTERLPRVRRAGRRDGDTGAPAPRHHPVLRRQLAEHLGPGVEPAASLDKLLGAVSQTYRQAEADRKGLEQSLVRSSEQLLQASAELRAILQAFPDLFVWAAPDGTIIRRHSQDPSAVSAGMTAVPGPRLQDSPNPTAARRFAAAVAEIGTGTPAVTFEYSLDDAGERRFYEARLASIGPGQILAIVRDITASRTVAVALERSVSALQATLESTTDGILVVTSDGHITCFNRKFVDLWRVPEQVVDARDGKLALACALEQIENPEIFDRQVRRLVRHPECESSDEVRLLDGRVFEVHSRAQRIGGAVGGRVWCFRDVTARHQAERTLRERDAQLRQAQKMEAIGMLAGGVAHDFNNLLTAINGYAALLLEEMDPDDKRRADVEQIACAGESAASLTRQLLAFGRRQVLKPEMLDLNAVVSRTDALLRRLIGENIDLVARLGEALHRVNVDPGQIEQIIMNLAINARDAMPQGGRLTLETANVELDAAALERHGESAPGPYVLLAVSDTGTGIPEEHRQHIFEPFFTTKPRGEGTGLGLATVYGIVKQSGGILWVYSEVGQGTTFKIYFPALSGDGHEMPANTASAALRGSETVLVAEDQADVRAVMEAVLTRHGYRVLVAEGCEQAVRLARQHSGSVDLLLADVVMPEMSGRELADRIQHVVPAVRVLYASGYTDESVVRHGMLEAGSTFIQKPFTPASLLSKIREVLDGR